MFPLQQSCLIFKKQIKQTCVTHKGRLSGPTRALLGERVEQMQGWKLQSGWYSSRRCGCWPLTPPPPNTHRRRRLKFFNVFLSVGSALFWSSAKATTWTSTWSKTSWCQRRRRAPSSCRSSALCVTSTKSNPPSSTMISSPVRSRDHSAVCDLCRLALRSRLSHTEPSPCPLDEQVTSYWWMVRRVEKSKSQTSACQRLWTTTTTVWTGWTSRHREPGHTGNTESRSGCHGNEQWNTIFFLFMCSCVAGIFLQSVLWWGKNLQKSLTRWTFGQWELSSSSASMDARYVFMISQIAVKNCHH